MLRTAASRLRLYAAGSVAGNTGLTAAGAHAAVQRAGLAAEAPKASAKPPAKPAAGSKAVAAPTWPSMEEFDQLYGAKLRADVRAVFTKNGLEVPPELVGELPVKDMLALLNDKIYDESVYEDFEPEERKQAMDMRAKIADGFAKQDAELIPKQETVDWEHWKNELRELGEDTAIIDETKALFDEAVASYGEEEDNYTPQIPDPLFIALDQAQTQLEEQLAKYQELAKEVEVMAEETLVRYQLLEVEEAEARTGTVYIDDMMARYPEDAKEIDQEILDNDWEGEYDGYSPDPRMLELHPDVAAAFALTPEEFEAATAPPPQK